LELHDRILFEDNHLVAVNKLPGELVQSDKTGDIPLSDYLKDYLKKKYNKPGNVYLGVLHRIDRPTSGVVIFARTSKAASRMSLYFKEKKIDKSYLAIVPKSTTIEIPKEIRNFLKKNEKKNKSYVSTTEKEGLQRRHNPCGNPG
jgi:23S rRNA pseudouridine1911/1915/1917 synthase